MADDTVAEDAPEALDADAPTDDPALLDGPITDDVTAAELLDCSTPPELPDVVPPVVDDGSVHPRIQTTKAADKTRCMHPPLTTVQLNEPATFSSVYATDRCRAQWVIHMKTVGRGVVLP